MKVKRRRSSDISNSSASSKETTSPCGREGLPCFWVEWYKSDFQTVLTRIPAHVLWFALQSRFGLELKERKRVRSILSNKAWGRKLIEDADESQEIWENEVGPGSDGEEVDDE